jgi:predicted double-glycine peptidase
MLLASLTVFVASARAADVTLDLGGGARAVVPLRSFKGLRDANVVKQALDYSCGAAALATLLTYGLNDPVSEADIILDMLATLNQDQEALRRKEGFSLLDMQRVAQLRGYRAQGFRLAPEDLGKLRGPVIVFINPRGFEHFAVLRGVRGDRVYLADPSLGNVRRAYHDFLGMWLQEDGKGIIFVVESENPVDASRPLLALENSDLPRPEMMSVRQLLEIGRTLPAGGGSP